MCANLREMSWRNNLEKVLVIKGKYLSGDTLDTRVDEIKSVLSCVNISNDSIVYINESIFGLLHTCEHSVE